MKGKESLELRRAVLRAAHFPALRIFELYAAPGTAEQEPWASLAGEFRIAQHLAGGAKPRRNGSAPGESMPLFLEAVGRMPFNVLDLDGAADPWPVWSAVVSRLRQRCAIFFSIAGPPSSWTQTAMGIPAVWGAPASRELAHFAVRVFLTPRTGRIAIESCWRLGDCYGLIARPLAKPTRRPDD